MAERYEEVLLSSEGLHDLQEELRHLRSVRRKEVAAEIRKAIDFGDISENAEYENAKNEQARLEGRIAELERILGRARVVKPDELEEDIVGIGSRVKVKNLESDAEFVYTIVGNTEADPARRRISYKAPVGKAVFGQRVGDEVTVKLPAGRVRYRLEDVEQPDAEDKEERDG